MYGPCKQILPQFNHSIMEYNDVVVLARRAIQSIRKFILDLFWPLRLDQGDSTHWAYKPTTTNSSCLFIQLLNLDTRFQIYKHLVPGRQEVQVIDIFEPQDDKSKALTALLSTNHEIHDEILLWYSQNTSWLTRTGPRGNAIQLLPTVQNTKYLLKWTSNFGYSWGSSKAEAAWHQFCFHNSTKSPIGPLVVEFYFSGSLEALSAFERLFAEAYCIEMERGHMVAKPLPIAPFLTSIEVVLVFNMDNHSWIPTLIPRPSFPPGSRITRCQNWGKELDTIWKIMWHGIGGCSIVENCGGDLGACMMSRRSRHPKLSWSVIGMRTEKNGNIRRTLIASNHPYSLD